MTKTILAARLAALIPELAKDSLLNREATIFGMLGELEATLPPKMSDSELADRLMGLLIDEMQYKSDCFDYLCWLEETHQRENVKDADFLVLASDGTTCWGKNYSDAVKVAMNHDKELYDAVQNLELPAMTKENEK